MFMRKSFFLFIAILAFAGIATDVYANQRVALVIGNSAYQHTARLDNPKNDAMDMAAVLKQLGFQVIDGFDLDKVAFERKVRDFSVALRAAEVGLFFYAGHGMQVEGKNYLVPVDAKAETADALDWEMVRLDLVQRTMERAVSTNIIFLDACRNNPLARNLARAMGTRSADIGRGLAPAESSVGTLISFSTQPGNVALDGAGRNSPFAGALVKRIATSNDDLSGLLIDVRNDVIKVTQNAQVPWEHSALRGRFYFNPATLTPTPTPIPIPIPIPTTPPPPTVLFPPRSVWTHNGSVMSVTMANNKIRILYDEPRSGIVAEGVRRGTLLFEGEAFGERLLGTAFVFDRRCNGGIPYQVSGDALQGRQKIIMTGQAPSQLDACQPAKYRSDTLVFDRKN
jgi:hypothetical protein